MTPQSSFMVLAPIVPERAAELRRLLASMNVAPGCVDANNPLIPFARFDQLHFARLLILDDKTTADVEVYGLPVPTFPLYLALLGDIDSEEDAFLADLATRAREGLQAILACCVGFGPDSDLLNWMKQHRRPSIANYINTRGRTVRQVREESALREGLAGYLASHATSLQGLSPREIHAELAKFVDAEKASNRLKLSDEAATPLKWWIGNVLNLLGVPLLLVLASPLLIVGLPIYLLLLRRQEQTDPEVCPAVDQEYAEKLSHAEDHFVTNQFSAMGSLKPGLVRQLTTFGVLSTVNYGARHLVRAGRLGRIRTIHFARWVYLDGGKRMVFFSNYDGSVESYMDDFINKTGFGLNASFSNGIGYPKTNWLVLDGCADERNYKEFLRRHTIPTQVWYKAYPDLTAIDLERNTRIRNGLEATSMSEQEAREWVALL
jgi:hypothetical protein